jgi:hypothetical protein
MKTILTIIISVFIAFLSLHAQEKSDGGEFGAKLKGFIKTDYFIDSRQTVSVREGHFLLYPSPERLDKVGQDVNASMSFNMLSIQTRLAVLFTAPDVLGAKTSGVVEGAFFGHSFGDINGFRLRHAYLKLNWKNSELLVGQYWHPMFITECFPGTISFNTGVPFQPFSRNPQIKYTMKFTDVYLSLTAASQRDFTSTGPLLANSSYLRNSGIPILDASLKYISKTVVLGAGANYKTLKPRLVTTDDYKTDATVSSFAAVGFARFNLSDFTIKFEGTYGQNLTDLLMLGGYAVTDRDNDTGIEEYTNVSTLSAWTDLVYGKDIQAGLFIGYTKNLGASDDITGDKYARGNNIASVMRISPRIQYSIGKVRFAAEVEYTSADYGTPNIKGEVEDTYSVANTRLLFAGYLFF